MLISDEKYTALKEWTRDYINRKCILRQPLPGKMPGSTYSWMFYLRRGLFNHEFLNVVSQMFIYNMRRELSPNLNKFQITGLETAATPIVTGLPLVASALGMNINSFVVRKDQKEYGLKNWIEGIPNENPVVMFDDLCNSGNSLSKCFYTLQAEGLEIWPVAFTIVNKSNENIHSDNRLKSDMHLPGGVKVVSLFTLDDFNLTRPSH